MSRHILARIARLNLRTGWWAPVSITKLLIKSTFLCFVFFWWDISFKFIHLSFLKNVLYYFLSFFYDSNIFTLTGLINSMQSNWGSVFSLRFIKMKSLKMFIFCPILYLNLNTVLHKRQKCSTLYSFIRRRFALHTHSTAPKWLWPVHCILPLQTDLLSFLCRFTAATFALCVFHFSAPLINREIFIIHIKNFLFKV